MSTTKRPSFQFYPSDWSADIKLRSTSIAARGLWIEIMCIMHQSDVYGFFPSILIEMPIDKKIDAVKNDQISMIDRMLELNKDFCSQLSRMVGSSESEVHRCMRELARAQVFSFSDDGRVFSKRMVKDENLRNVRAASGRLGGNPAFTKKEKHPELVKGAPEPSVSNTPSTTSTPTAAIAPFDLQLAYPSQPARHPHPAGHSDDSSNDDHIPSGVVIGDEDIFYVLSGNFPHQTLALTVTEKGKVRLSEKHPDMDIGRLCNRLEFYWNTSKGAKKRPRSNVFAALNLAAKREEHESLHRKQIDAVAREPNQLCIGLVNRFNAVTKGLLPAIELPLTFTREQMIKSAMEKHPSYEYWMDVFNAIKTNTMPPNCAFDWLIKDENNWIRVKERTFSPRNAVAQAGTVNSSLVEKVGAGVTVSNTFGKR